MSVAPISEKRQELARVLRQLRARIQPSEVGLREGSRRRVPGLRRHELADLAGISLTWYTWLEQGRDINVSREVLTAISRVLRLTADEADFVVGLAEHTATGSEERMEVPAHLQRLVDALTFPAFVVATDWTIAGWNAAYAWLYPRIVTLEPEDRNLLWLIYTDPHLREMIPEWDAESRRFLAEFRAESGVRLSGSRHQALVQRLREASPEFGVQWAEQGVSRFTSRRRTFIHHTDGPLAFEHHRLVPSDAGDLHLVLYVPLNDEG